MSLKRLDDPKGYGKICNSPEHNPPMHIYLEPGTYEWTCPVCGAKRVFTVQGITCGEMR